MQNLTPTERASCVNTLADLLISKQDYILEANQRLIKFRLQFMSKEKFKFSNFSET